MAFWQRKPSASLLHHSDRGSQYTSYECRSLMSDMKMNISMSGKGECWHNAPAVRFFRSLKHEQLNYVTFKTKKETKLSILDYLAYNNGLRSHTANGYLSPLQYEKETRDPVSGFCLLLQ